jgi:hypothetical protein
LNVARLTAAPRVEVARTARVTAVVANFMTLCDLGDGHKKGKRSLYVPRVNN